MFKRTGVLLITVIVSAVAFVGLANAQHVTDLPGVVVTATTSDNVYVSIPVDYLEAARFKRAYASIGFEEYTTDLTRFQVCQVLKQHPPENCTTSNYPASPGIPSAAGATWAANGCGTGPRATVILSEVLHHIAHGLYSGDLNKPVKGNPSIDFTAICGLHDRGYTSTATKNNVDDRFRSNLTNLCNSAPSGSAVCQSFADTYFIAVSVGGGAAYADDQKQLACSAWGDSMKKSGCV